MTIMDIETLRRTARTARLGALVSVLQLITKHQIVGNDLGPIIDDIKRALEMEMEELSEIQLKDWGLKTIQALPQSSQSVPQHVVPFQKSK